MNYNTIVKITKKEAKSGCTKTVAFANPGRQYQVNIPSGTKNGRVISFFDTMTGDNISVTVKVKSNAFAVIAVIIVVSFIISFIASRNEENKPYEPGSYTPSSAREQAETYSPRKQDYYNQLNSIEKRMYAAAYNAAREYKTEFKVKMTQSEYDYLCDNETQFIAALALDHPELMHLKGEWTSSSTHSGSTYTLTVTSKFNSWFTDMPNGRSECEKAYQRAKEVAASIMAENSYEYLRVLGAHDFIVANTDYDRHALKICKSQDESGDSGMIYSAYGLFANGRAVCEGYAKAFKLLLDLMDIPCVYVSTKGHGFNIAWIDGEPTYIDACWDDNTRVLEDGTPDTEDWAIEHEYFGMTTSEIEHIDSHHVSESPFDLPICTATGLRYHRFMGEYTQFYDFETVKNIVTKQSEWGLSSFEVLFGSLSELNAALDDLYGDNAMIWKIPCLKGHKISHSSNDDTFVLYINILE